MDKVGKNSREIEAKLETINQNVNLLIQDVRDVQKKVDAMEGNLLPTAPVNKNPPYGTLLGPVTCEVGKSFAEKEYSDNIAPKEESRINVTKDAIEQDQGDDLRT